MNKITKILVLAFMAVASMACNKIDDPQGNGPEPLEVNTNNISGKWELVEWNGAPMAEGTYVYMDIERGKTYTMYQNLDSFSNIPHVITGSYNLATDPELGAIIRGSYDHDNGDWAHRYIIKDLYENEMLWVAKDDPAFTQKFRRVSTIPVL
jgi:hypothetical protein